MRRRNEFDHSTLIGNLLSRVFESVPVAAPLQPDMCSTTRNPRAFTRLVMAEGNQS